MALATTCPQCKTSFKVVPDQLKLRRGLVRCGVCQHVFSGIDFLRYVDDAGSGVPRPEGEAHRTPEPRPPASGRSLSPAARARFTPGDRAERLDKPIERRPDGADRRDGDRSPLRRATTSPADAGPMRTSGLAHPPGTSPASRAAGDLGDDDRSAAPPGGGPEHSPTGERLANAADEDFDNGPPTQFIDFEAIDPAPLDVDRPEALSAGSDGTGGDGTGGDATSSDGSTGSAGGNGTGSDTAANDTVEDDLKTEFFMADSEDGPFARIDPGEVQPPQSIVQGAGPVHTGEVDAGQQAGMGPLTNGEGSAGTAGSALTGAGESAPSGAGDSGGAGDTDASPRTGASDAEAGAGAAVGTAVSDIGLDGCPDDGETGPDGPRDATGSRGRRNSRRRRTGLAAATTGDSARPGETAVAEPRPSKGGALSSALDTPAEADSATLPEAAGEHVQSLAEWIDGRSEAAAAGRSRRRPRRRPVEGREHGADDGAPPTDNGVETGERWPRPRAAGARSTRFPALPDDDGMARRNAGDIIDGDSGLLSGLLSGRKRRKLIIGLTVLAVLQLGLAFRDKLAASLPFTRPVLALLGAPLGLKIEPVRNIDQLSLEAFEIQDLGKNNQYMLSAIIRNSSGQPLRWPAMELVLMDPSRNVVVRKIIEPQTYLDERNRPSGIAPRSEQPIRLTIETRDIRMAGYNVALFYP